MGRFLGITGTPGTGKKTIAPLVARSLGLPVVGLNQLLTRREVATGSEGVDPEKLRRRLLGRFRGRVLVFGHLLPDVLGRSEVDRVVVLRCDPSVLKRRLRLRRYTPEKVAANVEAELIGVISASCVLRYGWEKVSEFDTTSAGARDSVAGVVRLLSSAHPRVSRLDWVPHYSSAVKLRSLLSVERTDSAFT